MKKIHKFIFVCTIFFSLNFYANAKENSYKLETLYDGLDMPWDIDFLPNGDFLISELTGKLKIYNPSLKTIFFGFDNVFLLSKSRYGPKIPDAKRLRYATLIIRVMNTDAARNRLLKKKEAS